MKVAVLRGTRSVVVEERPKPEIGAEEALVRIRAAGICGSDMHGFEGIWPDKRARGLVMGHENAGEVIRVGSAVAKFQAGDRVVIDPQLPCGKCDECLQGSPNVCRNMKLIGSSARGMRHGGFSEYVAMPARNLHRLADNVSYEEGTLFDPLGNAVHLVNRSRMAVGDRVAILGAGTLGLCLLLVARSAGAGMVIVADLSPHRLAVARSLGADLCLNVRDGDPVAKILEAAGGTGVDIAAEAVGIPETYAQCLSVVKRRGSVMALGNAAPEVALPLFRLVSWEISVIGCTGFSSLEIDQALGLMSTRRIDARQLITHRFALDEVQAAFETMADPSSDAIKTVLLP